MQPLCALRRKLFGRLQRIGVVNRRLILAAFDQPHAVAVAQIDGGNDNHEFSRTICMTWSNNLPLVEMALPPSIPGLPFQSVKVPPASSRIGRSGAQSQRFMIGSSIMSARPVATRKCP